MRFVVAVDGSESSLKAVKFTLTKLVKKDRKDELHLLMVTASVLNVALSLPLLTDNTQRNNTGCHCRSLRYATR